MITATHDTAVVILSYNSRKWLELFLPGVVAESVSGYDVIVVDHFSDDGTSSFIQQNFPSVTLLRLEENHGFAWGYSTALNQIKAKYYVLLSADFEVTPNWFTPLHTKMELHPAMAACQPKVRYYRDKKMFEYAGAAGGFMDKWGYMFCRGRIFSTLEEDTGQYDNDIEIFWASGGCFFVRADAYHEVGGLDPDLFAHMEEIDVCWRLKNAGYKIGFVHDSIVYHVGGSVISYGSPQKTFYNFRNNLMLLLKNERGRKLLWLLPFRLILDGIAGLQFLLKGDFKNVKSIISAHFNFYYSFKKWYLKRSKNLNQNIQKNTTGIFDKSIIISYFIKGLKTFSKLPFRVKGL